MSTTEVPIEARPPAAAALAPYVEAGLFDDYEVHLVATMARLSPGLGDDVGLALALAARAARVGHVCIDLRPGGLPVVTVDGDEATVQPVSWPPPAAWEQRVRTSPVVADSARAEALPRRPLVWDLGHLYLRRLWRDELRVAEEVGRRCGAAAGGVDIPGAAVTDVLGGLFEDPPGAEGGSSDGQRLAVDRGLREGVSIIAGGPGTGKTHTVARLLAATALLAARRGRPTSVALAAPTGKAANRMSEAVAGAVDQLVATGAIDGGLAATLLATPAVTLHRLLGARSDGSFRHDHRDPLPHDLVIVDETSMVSLPLLADLMVALRPEARLVLVGDPSQLTSIEAGTVMSDLVGPFEGSRRRGAGADRAARMSGTGRGVLDGRVTVLDRVHRYGAASGIAEVAAAVRHGRADDVVGILGSNRADVRWVRLEDESALASTIEEVVVDGRAMLEAARSGDAATALERGGRTKVLCAVRRGPYGRATWSELVRAGVLGRTPGAAKPRGGWYAGQPIMVTANDPVNRLLNGDVGIVVVGDGGRLQVAFREGQGIRRIGPAQLDEFDEWWAMTIHKSQGSEFGHAVVVLPESGSPILSRELLYTGVTRARQRLTVVASEATLRVAVERPVSRASGLSERLWGSPGPPRRREENLQLALALFS